MLSRRVVSLALSVSLAALNAGPAVSQPPTAPTTATGEPAPEPAAAMVGFSRAGSEREAGLERQFDAQLNAQDLRDWMERMSSRPNQVGSPHDRENAEWQAQMFRSWGWDTRIETFYVLYPTPIAESLELLGPTPYKAKLHEGPVPGDRTSAQEENVLPPYVAYQGDGDVTADLVYVNYGMPDDYKALTRAGVDVRGKIVIARYGAGWRGLKPKLAQLHGAVGCIIYSDPRDDGYFTDDVYPKGAQRPPQGVQRGSVQDMPIYPGDPLTPGVAATKDAPRLTREQAKTILKIPALPISYEDAQPLLAALGGPVAPVNFRGALPITYHIGPGPARVHLMVKSDWSLKPLYDVIATLPGSEYPDQWVIRGNHHDGWVFGASDPLSGQVALMEEAKAIGQLVKTGWRPKRTLVYASWDGEEPGLLGSTEWAEAHADELQKKAVVYVNSDNTDRGFFFASGSHSLQHALNQISAGVRDPETGVSVRDRLRARVEVAAQGPGADERTRRLAKAAASGGDMPIEALGSGSDYTPFLQHLGIASIDLRFGGEGEDGGVYHSKYDSFDHYIRFGDPNFAYGVALAETAGHLMLRTADADTPPLQFTDFANTVGMYLDELHELSTSMRAKTEEQDRLAREGAYRLVNDPSRPELPPARETDVPFVELAPLDNALARLKRSAQDFDRSYAAATAHGALTPDQLARLNAILRGIDQALLYPQGLPGREWFRNLVYAPGMETGYGVKTLPGVREAIEGRRWDEANRYAQATASVLINYADRLDQATAVLR
jgi:N-acetylated-alpha-linked acidic dipeptidase